METKRPLTQKVSFNLLNEYYEAMRRACEFCDYDKLEEFRKEHSKEFSFLNQIHKKRADIKRNVEAMKYLSKPLYFGTLTFNTKKDKNKRETKRKEAFKRLNELFECVLLVEEFGEERGRYHLHFIGAFRSNKGFTDFTKCWHSRQNLELIDDTKNVAQYLVKYVCKDIPRIRRNKALIRLEKAYHNGLNLEAHKFKRQKTVQVNKLLAFSLFEDL